VQVSSHLESFISLDLSLWLLLLRREAYDGRLYGCIRVWDMTRPDSYEILHGHEASVKSIAQSPLDKGEVLIACTPSSSWAIASRYFLLLTWRMCCQWSYAQTCF
jgi:WD40 repeat protein